PRDPEEFKHVHRRRTQKGHRRHPQLRQGRRHLRRGARPLRGDRHGVRGPERAVLHIAPACGTGYDSHRSEIQMWLFARMLSEYVAGILAKKVEEGHCNEHRKEPDLTPCPKTRPMHLDMLRAFRNDLASLVSQIDDKLRDLSRLPQA